VVFTVLADPRRRQILDLLRDGELPVGSLAGHLRVSQPAVSKHLKVLRQAGLVDVRRDAQRRLYRVRAEPLAEIDAWLAPYRALWNRHLDALERHLDAMPDDPAVPGQPVEPRERERPAP
jgi:DNA-binding transcriptional ArsR family regulator